MHYQVVVLDSETDGAMQITSLAWQRAPNGDDQGHYYDVEIYMGLCAEDAPSAPRSRTTGYPGRRRSSIRDLFSI